MRSFSLPGKCIDDEIPFEIPKSWEWSRLGDICSYLHRGKSPKYGEHKFLPIIAQKCNQWDKIYTDRCLFSSKDYIEKYKEEQFVQKGDIIINSTGGGTVGRTGYIDSYVFANFDRFVVDSHVTLVRSIYPIASKYVYYFLISPLIQIGLEDRCSGSTNQIELGTTTITSYLVPIPPIKEQYRIIDQFQKVLPLLERYSTNQIAQDKLNAEINIQLKKSILQEAIHGKLVPQITEEGTAKELLAEIRKEKEHLAKEGKLKKSALTDSIIFKGDDNKYYERINGQIIEFELSFEYPNSWAVLRLKDICQLIDGEKRNGKGVCLDAKYLRGKSSSAIVEKGKFVYAGDNIILVDGENSGEVFLVPQNGYMGSTFKQLWLSSVMWKPYVLAFILFYKEELRNSKRGAAIPHLNKELFYNLPIGIPPLAEQQRIAERINELSQLLK